MNITTPFTLKPHFYLRATIVACLIGVVAWAQPQKFQKVYGGYSYDQGNDLIQLPDTGYLLLCTSGSFSSSADIYLLKVDKQGNYEWQHTYGGQDIEGACKIKLTQDGYIAMAGHTNSYPGKSYDFYLVKAALNGDTVWTKHYGSNEWDFANSMDTCADGGFIMAGKTYDTGNAFSDILIVKTDADGNELWQKKIGGNKDDVANSIISLVDGYILCGTTESIGAGGKDIWVVKLDLNGNITSDITFGDINNDLGGDIVRKFDGNYGIACSSQNDLFPQWYNNFILNYNSLSNSIIQQYQSNYTNDVILNSIIELSDSTILAVGNISNMGSGMNDMFLVKLNNGFYFDAGSTYGGNYDDFAESVIKTFDNGVAIIGSTNSYGIGMSNVFFVKLDSTFIGAVSPDIYVNIDDKNQVSNFLNVSVLPNPFSQNAAILLELPGPEFQHKLQFNLLNALGQNMNSNINSQICYKGTSAKIIIDDIKLKNGIYFFSIESENKTIAQGKFTVIK
jgi:hypothetical protein